MIDERIICGYCRVLDQSRMVTVEINGKELIDVDCNYGTCPYESSCPIGKEIKNIQK